MRYHGSCHCGRTEFSVEGELTAVVECNCSICARKGALLWAVPREAFHLRGWEEELGRYLFHRNAIAHRFCRHCGIHPFAEDASPGEDGGSVYINIRCLDGVDPAAPERIPFDGRSAI